MDNMFTVPKQLTLAVTSPLSWLALDDTSGGSSALPAVSVGAIDSSRLELEAPQTRVLCQQYDLTGALVCYVNEWCALGARIDQVHVALLSVQGQLARVTFVGVRARVGESIPPHKPFFSDVASSEEEDDGHLESLLREVLAREREASKIATLHSFVRSEASKLIRHATDRASSEKDDDDAYTEDPRVDALFNDVRGVVESLSLYALGNPEIAAAAAARVAASAMPWGSIDPPLVLSRTAQRTTTHVEKSSTATCEDDEAARSKRASALKSCVRECAFESCLELVLLPIKHYLLAIMDEHEAETNAALRRFVMMEPPLTMATFGVPQALIERGRRLDPEMPWRAERASMRRVFARGATHRVQVGALIETQQLIMQTIVDAASEAGAGGACGADDLLPIFGWLCSCALREMSASEEGGLGGLEPPHLRVAGGAALLRATLSSKQRWSVALYAATNLIAILMFCAGRATPRTRYPHALPLPADSAVGSSNSREGRQQQKNPGSASTSLQRAARRLSVTDGSDAREYMRVLRVMEQAALPTF